MDVKAIVDKQKNRVIFVEAEEDFVDVLFSFLTMPMGAVSRNVTPEVELGCMHNLLSSVANLESRHFWSKQCKDMLLQPKNGAAAHCMNLKVKIGNDESLWNYRCNNLDCTLSKYKLLSHFSYSCDCGAYMGSLVCLFDPTTSPTNTCEAYSVARVGKVFVRGLTQLLVSDELQVLPLSSAGSLSLLSSYGVMDVSAIEERNFKIGKNEVLNLLKWSLVSKTSLTETLLEHKPVPQLGSEKRSFIQHGREEHVSEEKDKICVKLTLSKSKKMVCYAEANQDFVNLLFSFLTIPLGCVVKKMQGCPSKQCINSLYESVQNLDAEKYLKSNYHKEILVNPKIAPGFGYENQQLGVEEAVYYYSRERGAVHCYSTGSETSTALNVTDPRFDYKNTDKSCVGFVGPAAFTVTDDLIITPLSQIWCFSVLSKLKVPFSDIEECVVHIGNEEVSNLLVASFVSKTALTDALIHKVLKKEY